MQMIYFVCYRTAKVPCKHVVELAKTEVLGNPQASREMKRFARIPLSNAEKGVHKVLKDAGLLSPVTVDHLDLGIPELKAWPHVKLSSWVLYLLDTKRFAKSMTGVASYPKMNSVLAEFWKRYRALKPEHPVLQLADSGLIQLEWCVPFLSHTDEGRSYQHAGIWVMSSAGCIGRGTRSYLNLQKHKAPLDRNQMGLNFTGHTFSTNFLYATMLRTVYQEHPTAMEKLLEEYARDAEKLLHEGVASSDGRYRVWLAHLSTKGDLPALAKIGSLKRTFSHVPRAPKSKKPCQGICHLCAAGQEEDRDNGLVAIPFEDVNMNAAWQGTIYQTLPWDSTPKIIAGLNLNNEDAISFFATDLWHNLHLGVAKSYLGCSFACIVESGLDCLQGGSIDAKFAWITTVYRDYFKAKKVAPYISEISRDTMNFPQSSACPSGKWSKGHASTQMMLFLGFFAENYIVGKTTDGVLTAIVALEDLVYFCFVL